MSQNTSHAVMAQRHEAHDSLDYFPTPPWATRALCEHVINISDSDVAWEPACGEGHMAKPLAEYFQIVRATDVHNYGFGALQDFLWPGVEDGISSDWLITNPPFNLAAQFALKAISIAQVGVAMFVRTSFLEGIGRWRDLFTPHPPALIAQFTERVTLLKGRIWQPGASQQTATAYCWIVWLKGPQKPTQFVWIPQCRKQLERAEDYEVAA